jgi:TraM recognition site of TraD and TraG
MALEFPDKKLLSPAHELAYLREQIRLKELELEGLSQNTSREDVTSQRILHHKEAASSMILAPTYAIGTEKASTIALNLDPESDDETMQELKEIMETKGIKNAFTVLENLNSPHLEDDFHRFLVQYIMQNISVQGFSDKQPAWKSLHMTLYEIALPELASNEQDKSRPLKELISAMEQFYSGMLSTGKASSIDEPQYFSLELAIPVDAPHLMFYAGVPNSKRDLFEKQLLAIFPNAHLTPQPNDYNVFTQDGTTLGSIAALSRPKALSLKDYTDFDYDPLNSLLNAFAKIAPENEGASLQIIIEPQNDRFTDHSRRILHELRIGEHRDTALRLPESVVGEAVKEFGQFLFGSSKEKVDADRSHRRSIEANKTDIEQVEKKLATPIVGANIRLVVSSRDPLRAQTILSELESAFHQFENPLGNRLDWNRVSKKTAKGLFHDFAFRLFEKASEIPLSIRELTTMYHFPPKGIESSPHLKQARFAGASAPLDLPKEGIQLGTNTFRGQTTDIKMETEDRLRHMYVIGQTGAGKTGYLKTLIEQDIKAGNGVCFIDPHGNDILDVLASIPPERYEDVIYFDPAYIQRPFGLNLLEYDQNYPEQKTFVVNEILAIFRRLYGDVPESMGPAFEQYFRNATLLVMEDPESGSTLMDIGRVLSNAQFRNLKLSRSKNPIVNQFWTEIATKAEGEASLQNIVPYITNKFDDFTANDFMRPIIGQQHSSFNFREVIDTKKILLVNLSKGRLGERNANLLGLILVGKLFMAALSRADNPRGNFPPFYLYIDEFQNITTDSIPGILSEARKYKLSLTIAHQYLAQIDEKIRDAVFGNVGSMTIFRVGQEDGEFFGKQFEPTFTASDFVNIENRNAYAKILARGVPQKPFNMKTLPLSEGNLAQVDDLRELSYLTYGRDRATIEEHIRSRYLS